MDDRTGVATNSLVGAVPVRRNATPLHRRFPTIAHMRQHARRHVPHFVFEYMDGGAGADIGIAHNWAALDAVELVPRYGVMPALPPVDVELFGRTYAAPIGIPPMGGPALAWPGGDAALARAAQRARVPYMLGTVGDHHRGCARTRRALVPALPLAQRPCAASIWCAVPKPPRPTC